MAFAHEIPARVDLVELSSQMVHAAACFQNEEEQQEGAAGHDDALDHVGDDNGAESADGGVDDDDRGEQQQGPHVWQTSNRLHQGGAADELGDHLGGKEHDQGDPADDDHRR